MDNWSVWAANVFRVLTFYTPIAVQCDKPNESKYHTTSFIYNLLFAK